MGIDFEEAPLPPGHAFFHGEKEPPPLTAGVVIAIGNCGIYTGPWGVRIEDTVVVGKEGPGVLTDYPYSLESNETKPGVYAPATAMHDASNDLKEEVVMFVVVISFPPIKEGKDAEFREWFAWTNKEFSDYKGLISRRLLKPMKGGNYVAIVEHESHETFMSMDNSPEHGEAAAKQLRPLLDGHPTPQFYEVIE